MSLCEYASYFGNPNTGIHSYRFLNLAIVDVVMTILFSYFLSYIFRTSFMAICVMLFILGIILHRIFCVRTTIDKLLFPNL
jgi:hypothetical protein